MSSSICHVHIHREWNPSLATEVSELITTLDAGHFEQHPIWATMDTEVENARYLLATAHQEGALQGSALVRLRKIRRFPFLVAEIPGGPVCRDLRLAGEILSPIVKEVTALRAVRLVVAPYLSASSGADLETEIARLGFRPQAGETAPATLLVDLRNNDEEILATFRKNTRYEVRRAGKAGVNLAEDAGPEAAMAFQELYDAMAAKGATPRPAPFFADLFRFLVEDPRRGFVLMARHEGRVAGGTVVLRHGRRAQYAFGASETGSSKISKGHLLQYKAMILARERGALTYDMGGYSEGIGDADGRSPVQKVNLWKKGFGGEVLHLAPPHVRVLRPAMQRLELLARRLSS